jgi:hypothetical protein
MKGKLVRITAHKDHSAFSIIQTGKRKGERTAQMLCEDCGTYFHIAENGNTMCNGAQIFECPWCSKKEV